MLYKYHVSIIKDQVVVTDKYYQEDEKPDDEVYRQLIKQYDADTLVLNTVSDTELELFEKENIDVESLK